MVWGGPQFAGDPFPVWGDPFPVWGDPHFPVHLCSPQVLEDEVPELGGGVQQQELEPGRGDAGRFPPLAAGGTPKSGGVPQTRGGPPNPPNPGRGVSEPGGGPPKQPRAAGLRHLLQGALRLLGTPKSSPLPDAPQNSPQIPRWDPKTARSPP